MSFLDFIKNLTPRFTEGMTPKERDHAKGCQIFFPSTVFFDEDHIDFIAMNDKDYCMMIKSAGSDMLNIRRNLEKEVFDRKLMNDPFCLQSACSEKMERLLSGTSKSADPGIIKCKYLYQ